MTTSTVADPADLGGYGSPSAFVDGFVPAMWVASLVPVVGVVAAVFAPREGKG
jgi:hypothetical protein